MTYKYKFEKKVLHNNFISYPLCSKIKYKYAILLLNGLLLYFFLRKRENYFALFN